MSQIEKIETLSPLPGQIPLLSYSNTVLIPGSVSQIIIKGRASFEIVGYSSKKDSWIGIVQSNDYLSQKTFFTTGTLARIVDVLDITNDTITIKVEGVVCFEIKEYIQTMYQFCIARVIYKTEENLKGLSKSIDRKALLNTFQRLLAHLECLDFDVNLLDECSNENLVKQLIDVCPLSSSEKQHILETDEIKEQTKLLQQFMEEAMLTPLVEFTKH